ncbi:MAG: hypothetical protein ACTSW2_06750 [Alphaproteobacteria bacterium]
MAERAIIVHSLEHARVAVAVAADLGVPVTLASAPGAAAYVGPQWFAQVIANAAAEHPDTQVSAILDCGALAGLALAALRLGIKRVRFTGRASTAAKLSAIARRQDAEIVRGRLNALDLLDVSDSEEVCRRWLARK